MATQRDTASQPDTASGNETPVVGGTNAALERKGRRWVVWSFVLCPCHLPITLGVLGTVFGGSALGPVIARNGLTIGLGISAVYTVGLGIGLRHIHLANKDADCGDRCTL